MSSTRAILALLPALLLGCGFHRSKKGQVSAPLSGGGAIDASSDNECGKVLDGDLFNKISDKSTSLEHDLAQVRFFTLSEQEAWTVYQQEKSNQTNGGGGANVNVIDIVDVSASGSGGHVQNFSDFQEAFQKARQEFNQYVSTDDYKNASDTYSSVVRDPNSIQAWSDCITQTSGSPKFRMVLRREAANEVLAQIYYSAGAFAGSLPKLSLSFEGANVSGNSANLTIGQGSKIFTLNIDNSAEEVGVTGETQDGNTDFSFMDRLPPTRDEFENSRCRLQNTLMLMAGKVAPQVYNSLESANYVAFEVASAPKGHGSESCQDWLSGV